MSINRVQFQVGLSLPEFLAQFGTEEQCESFLEQARWPAGYRCPKCGSSEQYVLRSRGRKVFPCRACHHQTSLIAGTRFHRTTLPLTVWFLAIYLISQAKTGLSAWALKRPLGVRYHTAWLVHHKRIHTMTERDSATPLDGTVPVEDADLGGELRGGKAGRGSENKTPFIAAVLLTPDGPPFKAKMSPLKTFSREAVADWARIPLASDACVYSEGLACFAAVCEIGCSPVPTVVGGRKPDDVPALQWVNIVLGNLKNTVRGAYHAFRFRKYGQRYLGAFPYRFNRRFDLAALPRRLIIAAASVTPLPQHRARLAALAC